MLGFFWALKKEQRNFFGLTKGFFWSTKLEKVVIFKVVIFLGIKYKPLSGTPLPPPIIKICEWGPWVSLPLCSLFIRKNTCKLIKYKIILNSTVLKVFIG